MADPALGGLGPPSPPRAFHESLPAPRHRPEQRPARFRLAETPASLQGLGEALRFAETITLRNNRQIVLREAASEPSSCPLAQWNSAVDLGCALTLVILGRTRTLAGPVVSEHRLVQEAGRHVVPFMGAMAPAFSWCVSPIAVEHHTDSAIAISPSICSL
ncbi:hypothetical protein AAFF_G00248620 [Aldrovandia affinis]|uniref:Uncharacterized protein n=1 Tax=Aldrovandia affinis TaxID=143900 RepID=A0AAD7W424_9TELE|nr:hypothetical protein AAFF_G00248620 [Aldrovandia affinis]